MVHRLSRYTACGIFQNGDQTRVSCIGRWIFITELPGKPENKAFQLITKWIHDYCEKRKQWTLRNIYNAKLSTSCMRQGGVRKQKTGSRGFIGKNSIMVQNAERVGREKEIDKAWWRLSPTSSRRLLTLEVESGQERVLDQQLDPWNQGHADGRKLWPQRKAGSTRTTARQAGLGRTHPFSSLLLPSDPMLLMSIYQNQLENRRQGNPKNPLQRGQPPEVQSRIGKGGNWSGEGGRQSN